MFTVDTFLGSFLLSPVVWTRRRVTALFGGKRAAQREHENELETATNAVHGEKPRCRQFTGKLCHSFPMFRMDISYRGLVDRWVGYDQRILVLIFWQQFCNQRNSKIKWSAPRIAFLLILTLAQDTHKILRLFFVVALVGLTSRRILIVLTCPKISSLTVNDRSSAPVMSFSVTHVMLWWKSESIASTSLRSHGLK